MQVTTIGLDLAKNVFQVHGITRDDEVAFNRPLRRAQLLLITSQLPIDTWHDVIGEPTFADAILDRLVHNAYRVQLDGQSMRKNSTKIGDENIQN